MAVTMQVYAYAGTADDSRFHEPLRHNYSHAWKEGETYRAAVCKGELMLSAHDSDEESDTFVLFCGACSRRVTEIEGHSIAQFLEKVSADEVQDGQMKAPRNYIGPTTFTGYLTPDYLRWCGYPSSLLEKVRKNGPQYVWKK